MLRKHFLLTTGVALFGTGVAEAVTNAPSPAPRATVTALALEWYRALQRGQIDRTKLSDAYSEHLPDSAVAELAKVLSSYGSASAAELMQTRTAGPQTIYYFKILLARAGDAVTMLIGFDKAGKVTGITFPSMGQA